ncbi:response regulator transcription factor [candidate division WOR-3 bacterium]|nr:response regulator transcription factor [candidate division WOR-3 bacterium]
MILFIEPNTAIRKRICDLLTRERILGVTTYNESLEMLAKFRNKIALIIANIRLLREILIKGTLFRLCQKLYIEIPPIIALYKRGDEKLMEEFEANKVVQKLVKYDSEDNSFPERYIDAVRTVYPNVIADMKTAQENWLRGEESRSIPNVQQWLKQEGFIMAIEGSKLGKFAKDMEEVLPLIKKLLTETENDAKQSKQQNYEIMYKDLKKKYDLLVKYIRQLERSAKREK